MDLTRMKSLAGVSTKTEPQTLMEGALPNGFLKKTEDTFEELAHQVHMLKLKLHAENGFDEDSLGQEVFKELDSILDKLREGKRVMAFYTGSGNPTRPSYRPGPR